MDSGLRTTAGPRALGRTMFCKSAVAAALLVVLLIPVSAWAVEPLDLGPGQKPGVAVDGYGTAYIAWIGTETPSLLHFCRLPRGAAACDVSSTLPAPGNSLSRPYVASYKPPGELGYVAVVSSRYGLAAPDPNQVWEFVSATGQDFDSGHAIGYPAFDEAVEGRSESTLTQSLFVATHAFGVEGMVFQAMPLEGGSAGAAHAVLSSTIRTTARLDCTAASTRSRCSPTGRASPSSAAGTAAVITTTRRTGSPRSTSAMPTTRGW